MRNRIIQTLVFSIFTITAIGQIDLNDLNGEWTVNNNDSSYYKSDTIILYQDINYIYGIKTCSIIEWKKDRRKFSIHYVRTCSEPMRAMQYNEKEKIRLKHKNGRQIIELKRSGKIIESFFILNLEVKEIDRNPYEIKILTLKRIKKTAGNNSYTK